MAVAVFVLAGPQARAQSDDGLYQAAFVVTGQGEPNRIAGFRECFRRVLVKLTGDPTVVRDACFPALAESAPGLVRAFRYRDLFEGRPLRDEQGSYDRPHALTVTFDPAGIDRAVQALGRKPWRDLRPRVVLLAGMQSLRNTFMLTADGTVDRSADMRASLAAAGERIALPVTLPQRAALEKRGLTAARLPQANAKQAAALAQETGGDVALTGRMRFSEKAFGWVARWRMDYRGRRHVWGVRGVNFDAALRNAMFGAAQVLSGRGAPGAETGD